MRSPDGSTPRSPLAAPSWLNSSCLSNMFLIVFLLILFLPKPQPLLLVAVHAPDEIVPAAAVGQWTALTPVDNETVWWMLDEATLEVVVCSSTTVSDLCNRRQAERVASSLPPSSSSPTLGLSANAHLPTKKDTSGHHGKETAVKHSKSKRMHDTTNDHAERAGEHKIEKEEEDHNDSTSPTRLPPPSTVFWGPRPASADVPTSGLVYLFSKTIIVNTSTLNETFTTTAAVVENDQTQNTNINRSFSLDMYAWWRDGNLLTSNLNAIRFYGGAQRGKTHLLPTTTSSTTAKIGDDEADPENDGGGVYHVVGIPQTTWGKNPYAALVDGNATLKAIAERIANKAGISGRQAFLLFDGLLRREYNHQVEPNTNVTAGNDSSWTTSLAPPQVANQNNNNTNASSLDILDDPRRWSREHPKCYWFGRIRTAQRQHRSSALPKNASSTSFSHSGVISATLFSTCGDAVVWTATEEAYLEMASSWNSMIFVFGIIPFCVHWFAMIQQWQWIRNSRTRSLRMSRTQLLVICLWQSFFVFYAEVAWSIMPGDRKMINVFYTVAVSGIMFTLHLFNIVDTEYRQAHQLPLNRSLTMMLFFFGMSAANLLPALSKTHMFSPLVLLVGSGTFWLPQGWHLATGKGHLGLLGVFVASSTLLAVSLLSVLVLSPRRAIAVYPDDVSVWIAVCILLAEGALVYALSVITWSKWIPRWMVPWRHIYTIPTNKITAILGGLEDPDCSICGDSFLLPHATSTSGGGGGGTATASDAPTQGEIWMTPCKHLFHERCLMVWMEQRMECPLCRKLLPEP